MVIGPLRALQAEGAAPAPPAPPPSGFKPWGFVAIQRLLIMEGRRAFRKCHNEGAECKSVLARARLRSGTHVAHGAGGKSAEKA